MTSTDKLKKLFPPKHIVEPKNVDSWIECGDNQPVSSDKLYCCSVCGRGRVFESGRTMFCPYCGADLRASL